MRNIKKAFTFIELIMVVVVIAILAINAIPRLKRDTRAEAINHMLTMIRYTQNLALNDNKHSSTDTRWQRSYWRFGINSCANGSGLYYYIGTDKDLDGSIDNEESAVDPSNGKFAFWIGTKSCPKPSDIDEKTSPNIFITQRYGINQVVSSSCQVWQGGNKSGNNAKHIGFDNFGRPMRSFLNNDRPNYNGYISTDCKLTFKFSDSTIKDFVIVIPKESGFAYLKENPEL